MKHIKSFIVVLVILSINVSFAQVKTKSIKLPEFYRGIGIIFYEFEDYPFNELNYKKSYTPTTQDIIKAERFLHQNYYDYLTKLYLQLNYNKNLINKLVNEKYMKSNKVKKKFCKFNRQYAGYINTSRDTIIYLGLLNFSKRKKAEKMFEGWKSQIVIGFGDFYYDNQKMFRINISKNEFVYKVK